MSMGILADLGAELFFIKSNIIRYTFPCSKIFSPEAYGTWKETADKYPEKMHRPILNRFQSGEIVSAPDYVRAWQN